MSCCHPLQENTQRIVLEEKKRKREAAKKEADAKKAAAGGKVKAKTPEVEEEGCIIDNLLKEIRAGTSLKSTGRSGTVRRKGSNLSSSERGKLNSVVSRGRTSNRSRRRSSKSPSRSPMDIKGSEFVFPEDTSDSKNRLSMSSIAEHSAGDIPKGAIAPAAPIVVETAATPEHKVTPLQQGEPQSLHILETTPPGGATPTPSPAAVSPVGTLPMSPDMDILTSESPLPPNPPQQHSTPGDASVEAHTLSTGGHALTSEGHALTTGGHAFTSEGHTLASEGHVLTSEGHTLATGGQNTTTPANGTAISNHTQSPVVPSQQYAADKGTPTSSMPTTPPVVIGTNDIKSSPGAATSVHSQHKTIENGVEPSPKPSSGNGIEPVPKPSGDDRVLSSSASEAGSPQVRHFNIIVYWGVS